MKAKYTITWGRPQNPGETFTCVGLTEKKLTRRLAAAAKNFGHVTVWSVEKEEQA